NSRSQSPPMVRREEFPMNSLRVFTAVGIFSWAACPGLVWAQAADRSCTKVLQMALQASIRRLPQREQQRYSTLLPKYEKEMDDLYKKSGTLEDTVKKRGEAIQPTLIGAIIQSREDLVRKHQEALMRENADLTERVKSGSEDADKK